MNSLLSLLCTREVPSGRQRSARSLRLKQWFCSLLLLAAAAGCGEPEIRPGPGLQALSHDETEAIVHNIDLSKQGLNSWQELGGPLEKSLAYVAAQTPEAQAVDVYGFRVTWRRIQTTLERLQGLLPQLDQNPRLLQQAFSWYELRPPSLLTGYYEPLVPAALEPRPGYPHPIYGRPTDLQTADLGNFHPRWKGEQLVYRIKANRIQPYPDRRAIEEQGALEGKAEVLAWAKDLVDVFFLQIQGSGRLHLPDGSLQPIGYAAKNGRRYTSLGRYMAAQGLLERGQLSMQSIRDYLDRHPELLPEILYSNPSYVFFQLRQGGPYGAMGQELTPRVSVATDPRILPLGSLLLFQADLPDPGREGRIALCGPGLPQDVGGAIRNHHLDLFCGFGPEAGALAGVLKEQARVFLLLAK
jgi:membrane-bound lytic murein transglycosylase A